LPVKVTDPAGWTVWRKNITFFYKCAAITLAALQRQDFVVLSRDWEWQNLFPGKPVTAQACRCPSAAQAGCQRFRRSALMAQVIYNRYKSKLLKFLIWIL